MLSVFASFGHAGESADTLQHLLATVIPAALLETSLLGLIVTIGVVSIGATTAWLVATCDFIGRRTFEWAMLLPLAMPAYIMAYAYTDFLQFAGSGAECAARRFGWRAATTGFPRSVRWRVRRSCSSFVLYPYVYLLARTAFLVRTAAMIDAARSLGLTACATWSR